MAPQTRLCWPAARSAGGGGGGGRRAAGSGMATQQSRSLVDHTMILTLGHGEGSTMARTHGTERWVGCDRARACVAGRRGTGVVCGASETEVSPGRWRWGHLRAGGTCLRQGRGVAKDVGRGRGGTCLRQGRGSGKGCRAGEGWQRMSGRGGVTKDVGRGRDGKGCRAGRHKGCQAEEWQRMSGGAAPRP